jgi:hypothetical protein
VVVGLVALFVVAWVLGFVGFVARLVLGSFFCFFGRLLLGSDGGLFPLMVG